MQQQASFGIVEMAPAIDSDCFCIIIYLHNIPAQDTVAHDTVYLQTVYLADQLVVVDVEIEAVYFQAGHLQGMVHGKGHLPGATDPPNDLIRGNQRDAQA